MDSKNKYVERALRVEKRINGYSKGAEKLVINSIDLIQDLLTNLNKGLTHKNESEDKMKRG